MIGQKSSNANHCTRKEVQLLFERSSEQNAKLPMDGRSNFITQTILLLLIAP